MKHLVINRSSYQDSFNLMLLASQVRKLPGVNDVALFMGTVANKKRLKSAGYNSEEMVNVEANDLLIALDVESEEVWKKAIQETENFLTGKSGQTTGSSEGHRFLPRSIEGALRNFSNPNLVSISLPGAYAGREARKALENNLHVFLFSDNVPIEEEIELKRLARTKGLLMMGPDCGTARIGQNFLGFCNDIASGEIGIVAASGTGAQEIMCLLDRSGVGVSHVLGTGGRDLHKSVGAIMSKMGLCALNEDPKTRIIVYVSKPGNQEVKEKLIQFARQLTKPVIFCFIGEEDQDLKTIGESITAENLHHAAQIALSVLQGRPPGTTLGIEEFRQQNNDRLLSLRRNLAPGQRYIRGLYSGGSLADEAAQILAKELPDVRAGSGFGKVLPIQNWEVSIGHTIIDMGEDHFTQGRPHPMIDFHTRIDRFRQEAQDPSVAAILFDIILGTNAHPDPAGEFWSQIMGAKVEASKAGRSLIMLVHICGTDKDPQNYTKQVERFDQAGCWVFGSNIEAAMAATCLVSP